MRPLASRICLGLLLLVGSGAAQHLHWQADHAPGSGHVAAHGHAHGADRYAHADRHGGDLDGHHLGSDAPDHDDHDDHDIGSECLLCVVLATGGLPVAAPPVLDVGPLVYAAPAAAERVVRRERPRAAPARAPPARA